MARLGFGSYALMVSIMFWGTLLGAVTYSHLVYFPAYLSALPDSAVVVNGPYGLSEGIFWMLVHPLTIISLLISIAANWSNKPRRKLIIVVFGVYVVILIMTQIYFLPELGAFKASPQSSVSAAEWLERGNRWQHLSWIRGAVMYACIFPLLIGLTKRKQ